jgi:hypothetical protein
MIAGRAMPRDNPLVIGSPYALPVWFTVTLKFIEACDDRVLNREPGTKAESPRYSAHLTGLAWINSQDRKPFLLAAASRGLPVVDPPSGSVFCPKLRLASADNCY